MKSSIYSSNVFCRLLLVFNLRSLLMIVSRGIIAVLALVPISSRFRTFTEQLSSSSWPTTIGTPSQIDVPVNAVAE